MYEFAHSLVELCHSLAALGAILLAAFGLGHVLIQACGLADDDDPLATLVWSIATGLCAAGMFWTLLGLIGLIHQAIVAVVTLAAAFWALGETAHFYFARRRAARLPREIDPHDFAAPPPWLRRLTAAAAVAVSVATLVCALAPPTAGDALCYHLELPKNFLRQHAIVYLPFSDNSTYPLFMEMFYLWGLALEGPVAAQLIAWAVGLMLAAAAVLLATPCLGRPWAWLAGMLVFLVPGILAQMTAPLCDSAVALWLCLAMCAWRNAAVDPSKTAWQWLCGAMCGAAMATKYIALPFLLVAAMLSVFRLMLMRRFRPRRLPGALAAGLLAVAIACPWYIRAAWYRGDPVFPFGGQLLGSDGAVSTTTKTPLCSSAWTVLTSPWRITMHPEQVGGRSHQLGAVFLAVLPGLVFVRRLRGLRGLLYLSLGYAIIWFLLRQNVRFLYPVVPPAVVGVAWGLIEMRRMPWLPRALALGAVGLALCSTVAIALYRTRDKLAVATGRETRQHYLYRTEPSFVAASILNRLGGRDAQILSEDYRGFYFQGRFIRDSIYRQRTGYHRTLRAPNDLSRQLRRAGFTHLLLVENEDALPSRPGALAEQVAAEMQSYPLGRGCLLPMASYRARDADGQVLRYRLILIR
jgi:hypothetical protein